MTSTDPTTPVTATYSRKYRGETKTEQVIILIDRADEDSVRIKRVNGDVMWVHRNRITR